MSSDSSRAPRGGDFDWPGVRAAIDSLGRILEPEGQLPGGDEARAILQQRAVALAAVESAPTDGRLLEIVVFAVAGERYAIESRYVHEVLRRPEVARLPGATPPVFGLAARRGEILTILDLRHLLALPPAIPGEEPGFLVALGERDAVCGVLVDSIEGLLPVDDAEFHDTRSGGGERSPVRRIAPDALTLIDAAALLQSPY